MTITINGKTYSYIFESDELGAYVRIGDGDPVYANVSDLRDRWGDGFDAEEITEEQWDALEAELKEKAIYDLAGTWSVFEADSGEVYLETSRDELDDLCARGYAEICRVSGSGSGAIISYIPSAKYGPDRKYWRKILGSWDRQKTDWKRDYARIARIRDEEAKEREQNMKSITINNNTYTADNIWYAVQRNSDDAWDNGSEDYDTAVGMLRAQGHGRIAVIDDDAKVCLGEILYSDLFDDEETLYILRDLDGYGNANPVCVVRAEAEELMRGWYATDANAPEFDDVWRAADRNDIARYGVSVTD